MIVMGSRMDGAALQEAARAHVKAIEGMDSKGVLTKGDFQAVLAGLGKAIAAYDALMRFKDTVKTHQPISDPIGDAAVELASASYPFMKEVPWNSPEFLLTPGAADPIKWTKAIGRIIDMGASMDPNLVKAGCEAHHAANVDLPSSGVCSEAELTEIYAAIGRMVASAPESKTMGVYDAVSALVDPKVPEYLMSKVTESNARSAYAALLK